MSGNSLCPTKTATNRIACFLGQFSSRTIGLVREIWQSLPVQLGWVGRDCVNSERCRHRVGREFYREYAIRRWCFAGRPHNQREKERIQNLGKKNQSHQRS